MTVVGQFTRLRISASWYFTGMGNLAEYRIESQMD